MMLPLLLAAFAAAAPEQSVVRIQVYRARPDWTSPWKLSPVEGGLGSGFLIDGNRILTNAHVVGNARQVLVKKRHVADPFVATIEAVGHDCDLAVLKVEDPAFLKGMAPLKLGGIPKTRDKVTTYGFPLGGEEVSSTSGIVSRVEWRGYSHTGTDAHLVVQTDAAINPGNSGGPVLMGDKVSGVAFQGLTGADNVGYFIPAPVVEHFLKDLKDGTYDGYPDSAVRYSTMISPALKAERKVPAGMGGVVIDALGVGGSLDGALLPGDVLLKVEKDTVADDGNITVADAQIPFLYTLDMKQVGEPVELTVLRDGKQQVVKAMSRHLARGDRYRNQYDRLPRYVVHAGIVFMPVDTEYLRTFGGEWRNAAPRDVLWHHFYREWEDPKNADREVVVIARVLRHPVNSQLAIQPGAIVSRINGRTIGGLADVAKALDENKDAFDVLEFETSGSREALPAAAAREAQKSILKTYAITKERNL